MKAKIICIIVMMLLIFTALPAVGIMNNEQNIYVKQSINKTVIWSENFDSYAAGSPLHGQGGWECWDLNELNTPYISNIHSHSASNSVELNYNSGDHSDILHLFYGIDSGQWTITAWWFLPEEFFGASEFILMNKYEHKGTHFFPDDWSLTLIADPGSGIVYNYVGGGELPLISNEWVEIRCEINFDLDTLDIYYNNTLFESTSWTRGIGEKDLACIDLANDAFYSNATYFDDISIEGEIGMDSDLECYGELDFGKVKSGETATGGFIVQNQGMNLLDWEVTEWPKDWGEDWSITPISGSDLGPYDPVIVNVEVVAPNEAGEYTGEIRINNSGNPDDYEIITVKLSRKSKTINTPFLNWLQSHPNMFTLLQKLLQNLGL